MKVYVDSSVIVRLITREGDPIEGWGQWELAITSEVAIIEVMRAAYRLRVMNEVTPEGHNELLRAGSALLDELRVVRFQPAILRRAAGHFPTAIGALDAIHLATALLWEEDTDDRLTFLTHDRQLRSAAQACGLATARP